MTLNELETVSETTDATKPMNARRRSHMATGCFAGSGIFAIKKLYYLTMSIIQAPDVRKRE